MERRNLSKVWAAPSLIMAQIHGPNLAPPAPIRGAVRKRRLRPVDVLRTGLSFEFCRGEAALRRERQQRGVQARKGRA